MSDRTVECYEISLDDGKVDCAECQRNGGHQSYGRGEVVLLDLLLSPYGDGQSHYICNRHLESLFPNDVIDRFDPYDEDVP